MSTRDPHDVVRLETEINPAIAHIVEQGLKAEGIDCKVVGDFLNAGIGNVPGMRPEIWVHREDVAKAEEFIKAHQHKPATS